MAANVGTIGQSVFIKGELSAGEDLTIEGQVEGKIRLDNCVLTIGQTGRIEADVVAKVVDVIGKVEGDISATETITIRESATVDGTLAAPSVGIEEGAFFRGQIDVSVRIPIRRIIRRLKPVKPHVRFFRRLIGNSMSAIRPEADPRRLFGASPKPAEATMRLVVEGDSRWREQANMPNRVQSSTQHPSSR